MNKTCIPHFIIIGAPKCGTTALWHFLDQHPDVCMGSIKEPRFFTQIKGSMEKKITGDGSRLSGTFDRGFQWYASLFENYKDGQIAGEGSTIYFANEDSPELIYRHNPNIRLILMLRHPVKRLYSHYWQEHKLGFDFPSFETMAKDNHLRYRYYSRISHYKQNIKRYFNYFKPEQIKILIQEEFNNEPEKHLNILFEFLNLKPHVIDLNKRINEQVTPKNKKLAFLLMYLRFIKINKFLPDFIVKKLKRQRNNLIQKNVKPFTYEPLLDDLYRKLYSEFLPDIEFVEKIMGREIKPWH